MNGCTTINARVQQMAQEPARADFCTLLSQGKSTGISYAMLSDRALQYAAAYADRGIERGSVISILLGHGPDMVYAFVGALLGGYIPSYVAPLSARQDLAHYWEQLRTQCHRLEGGILVTSCQVAEQLADFVQASRMQLITAEQVQSHTARSQPCACAADDIALLQHSSGTTGGRKGVALSHGAILKQVQAYADSIQLSKDDVIVSWLPLYHDMGLVSSFLLPMVTGTPLVLLDPFEWVDAPWILLDAVTRYRGTLVWMPNFAFHFLARVPIPATSVLDLRSMRAWINCSEPCKEEAFGVFLKKFATVGVQRSTLQICYAMAETVFAATQTPLGVSVSPRRVSRSGLQARLIRPAAAAEDETSLMPVGAGIPGMKIRISADDGSPLPDGHIGEVLLSADFVFSGYHRDEALSSQAFYDGYYRTGDLGALVQGVLYITGRQKDVIIVNGKNFYAHDLEAAANQVVGIKAGRCVAFGIPNALTGSEGVCIVAESELAQESHTELVRRIKETVQRHTGLVIAKATVVPLKWLVKTTSGKISRAENRDKFLGLQHAATKEMRTT
jgi:acyl-CoA synthetase (AMP-forming)/AMP-acid ligase II